MKIELATIICSKQEIPWLDFGLESILEHTKYDINTTLYLARYTDEMFEDCGKVCDKYNINFEPRGDNYPIGYVNETKHNGFDVNGADCVMSLQPDVVFMKKDSFDKAIDEASDYFDAKYYVCVSSDNPKDVQPLGITIHTKLGWEKIGCEDINYYPQCGVEHDYNRRAYIEYGLDLQDSLKYAKYVLGLGETPPEWVYRVCSPDLVHLEKDWNQDPRLGGRTGVQHKLLDYGMHLFGDCIIHDSYVLYYVLKWGAFLGEEHWVVPFNEEELSIKIEWEQADDPYPQYNLPPTLKGCII